MPKKTILEVIKIDEISAVDRPAQPGATSAIMKRHDPKKSTVIGKNVKMTTAVDGHQHTIDLTGWEGEHLYGGNTSWIKSDDDDEGHQHPWVYDAQGGLVIGEALGHRHDIEDFQKSAPKQPTGEPTMAKRILKSALASALLCSTAIAKFDEATAHEDDAAMIRKAALDLNIGGMLPTDGPLSKASADEDEDDADKKKKEAEEMKKFQAIASLTGVQKSHYDTLDENGQAAYLKMDSAARDTEISKSKDADPVVYTSLDGSVFRKSDDERLVKSIKAADDDRRQLAKSRVDARTDRIEKSVGELGNLPGETDVKKALVGAIEDIKDPAMRKGAYEILKGANDIDKSDFKRAGKISKADVADADNKLEKMAQDYAAEHSVPYEKAFMAVTQTQAGGALYKALRAGPAA